MLEDRGNEAKLEKGQCCKDCTLKPEATALVSMPVVLLPLVSLLPLPHVRHKK